MTTAAGFMFRPLSIPDVIEIELRLFEDERGFFVETYRAKEFSEAGITLPFVQDNCSRSTKGVLRGLHYQLNPKAQGKLLRCVRGSVFDVAVDIRRRSQHYGRWVGLELSDANGKMVYVPPGFAHGFLTLSDTADILYKQTDYYSLPHQRGIRWDDPSVAIAWPLSGGPVLSPKDVNYPALQEAENNF